MAKGIAKGLADSDGIVFPVLPSGKYEARVTKLEDKPSGGNGKHPGTPMVEVTFRIVHDDPAFDGKVLRTYMMLPYAAWMEEEDNRKQLASMAKMYTACGLEATDEYDTDDWMGCEVIVVVTEKEYPVGSATMVNNISDVLSAE